RYRSGLADRFQRALGTLERLAGLPSGEGSLRRLVAARDRARDSRRGLASGSDDLPRRPARGTREFHARRFLLLLEDHDGGLLSPWCTRTVPGERATKSTSSMAAALKNLPRDDFGLAEQFS